MTHKLYIGNVPQDVNEGSLRELFETQAEISPRSVLVKKGGYAFVECPDPVAAAKAIERLNGYNIMGSQLLVEPSVPQNRRNRPGSVHISNIPELYPWDDINRLVSGFGNVQQCDKGTSKSGNTYTCTVTYENQEQAQIACQQLNNYELDGSSVLKVEYLMEQGQGRGARGRSGTRPYMYSGAQPPTLRPSDFPLRILVLSDMVGAIIGRAGGTIRSITQQSRARVDVHRKENAGSPEKVITIYGNPENCSSACLKILEVMQQESNNTNRGEIPLKILAHNNLIGRIIGKSGSTIKRIMEQSETKITVSSIHDVNSFNLERIITVKGQVENLSKAEQMISAKLRQCYENDLAAMAPQAFMFPGVHPMAVMSTIGAPGYPPLPRGGPSSAPYGMYGSGGGGGGGSGGGSGGGPYMPMMYQSNSAPVQPDVQKETVFVFIPNTAVGAIIGTGGSTIRDMISSSGASIKVAQPNKEESVEKQSERRVTVIGTAEAQWKAQFMIFKKVTFEGYSGPQDAQLRVEIMVPSNQVGRIIGKGGQTVRELQRLTHGVIKFPEESQNAETEETPVHIIGDFYATQAAQRQIRALVNRSMMAPQRRRGPPQQPQPPPQGQN